MKIIKIALEINSKNYLVKKMLELPQNKIVHNFFITNRNGINHRFTCRQKYNLLGNIINYLFFVIHFGLLLEVLITKHLNHAEGHEGIDFWHSAVQIQSVALKKLKKSSI